jgi:hypothetical protein
MATLQVYDPPLCCPTGVCGPGVDPALARFAADLDWLRSQGVAVERFNLAQQPAAFASRPAVQEALARDGTACLPLVLMEGHVISRGRYPSRADLAAATGLGPAPRSLSLPLGGGCCGDGGPSSCC